MQFNQSRWCCCCIQFRHRLIRNSSLNMHEMFVFMDFNKCRVSTVVLLMKKSIFLICKYAVKSAEIPFLSRLHRIFGCCVSIWPILYSGVKCISGCLNILFVFNSSICWVGITRWRFPNLNDAYGQNGVHIHTYIHTLLYVLTFGELFIAFIRLLNV